MTPAGALLVGLVFIPLLAALAGVLLPTRRRRWAVLLGGLAWPCLLVPLSAGVARESSLNLVFGGWAPPLGIGWRLDALALVVLWVHALAGIAALASAWQRFEPGQPGSGPFWPLWMLLATGINLALLAADLFNLYVALELTTLAAVALIATDDRIAALAAAMRYLLLAVLGSLLYLLGVGLAYAQTGSLAMHQPGLDELNHVALVVWIALAVLDGERFEFRFELVPGLELILHADALSILFASLSAVLWLVTTVYAVAYLEHSPNRARFFGFFSLCVSATMGIAMAGNLLTLFLFYELLTLTTWPLVVHNGTRAALAAGRSYLRYTLTGGVVLLTALVWLYGLAGTVVFTPGGFLAPLADAHRNALTMIFVMLVAGFGVKAGLVPLHGWLPKAMVAPAPVSALLHAVAVVKAGAFGIIRTVEDVYGLALVADLGLRAPLIAVAGWTVVIGSLLALRERHLKRRLAYSTVSQVSYIVLGIAVGGLLATSGGMVHLVHQGLMKVTLFFCAGIFGLSLGVSRIDQLDGLGRRMPWASAAFTVAALGMIGLPPLVGFVSKWYLAAGALAAGLPGVLAVLIASALLNAAYFLPLVRRLWLNPPGKLADAPIEIGWLPQLALVSAALATAALTAVLGLLASHPLSPLNWVIQIARGYGP